MKRLLILALSVIGLYGKIAASNGDSLKINFDDLNINCKDEAAALKGNFDNFDSLITDILKMECKSSYAMSANSSIQQIVTNFKNKELTKKYTLDKYIIDVYKAVHQKFFVGYELNVPLYRVFDDGTYNCVTASIIYAYIFKKLNINYVIKETPTHVYLVAEPQTLNITIETTAPTFGYILHDEKFKAKYINYLVENKIINKEDAQYGNTNELFNKYYYEDQSIDFKQLISILYYNKAVEHMQNEALEKAIVDLEKSSYVQNSKRTTFYYEVCLIGIIQQNENNNKRDLNLLNKLSEFTLTSDNKGIIKAVYNNFSVDFTEKNPDIERYKTESEKLFAVIKDSVLLNDLKYQFHYSIGLHSFFSDKYEEVIEHLSKALAIYPNNIKLKALLNDCIKKQLSTLDDIEEYQEIADTLMSYAKKYPFLIKDKQFKAMIEEVYSELAYENIDGEDRKTMDAFLAKFDREVKENLFGDLKDEIVGVIYAEAQRFFIKLNNFTLAKEYIQRGLQLSPNNKLLMDKLNYLK